MQPHAWIVPGLVLGVVALGAAAASVSLAACGSDDSGSGSSTSDSGPITSGMFDAGTFTFSDDAAAEAGPLLSACNPGSASSCTTGFTCFAQHTSAAWWVDLYGTCTFDCTSQTLALCNSLDGVCACPVPQGGTEGNCSADGGVAMVCVPAVKPGTTPGSNDGDGGCGTPGCGGGAPVDSGVLASDAAGD